MCGGTLDIQSSDGSGSMITISIPTPRAGEKLYAGGSGNA
jgi:hypothetical protein